MRTEQEVLWRLKELEEEAYFQEVNGYVPSPDNHYTIKTLKWVLKLK